MANYCLYYFLTKENRYQTYNHVILMDHLCSPQLNIISKFFVLKNTVLTSILQARYVCYLKIQSVSLAFKISFVVKYFKRSLHIMVLDIWAPVSINQTDVNATKMLTHLNNYYAKIKKKMFSSFIVLANYSVITITPRNY